ncbi:MAG: LytTR family DNA-binding domain-containing protein [Bacilli bacterium]
MIRIAVVEDSKSDTSLFKEYVSKYQTENNSVFDVHYFNSGVSFLEEYKAEFDIIFMDIDLPEMNGLDVSAKLRERDSEVVLIFLTNLAKYAIKGYSVNAFDFVAKPITYYSFSTMLKRAINKCGYKIRNDITINNSGSIVKINVDEIAYIEVYNHQLVYHTDKGDYPQWGSLSSIEEEYIGYGFSKGNSSQLINLRRVSSISGSQVTLDNNKVIYLSRSQKKDFALRFTEFIAGDGK